MRPGSFFYVVGASGVGKDTLINGAREALANSRRHVFARRIITRAAGDGAEDHHSVDVAEFMRLQNEGALLLSWRAHGLHYGLSADLLVRQRQGCHIIANGSRTNIRQLAQCVAHLVVVHVHADTQTREQRLVGRGREVGDAVAARLCRAVELDLPDGVDLFELHNATTVQVGVQQLLSCVQSADQRLTTVAFPVDTWRQPVAYLPSNSILDAVAYLGPERIDIVCGWRSVRAVVHVAEVPGVLAPQQIGLSRQTFADLGLPEGTAVHVHRTPQPESRAALRAKIQGGELTEQQIALLMQDIQEGRYSDAEIAAFLVAATTRLSAAEVLALARARAGLMPRVDWGEPMVVDKHSMGGIPGSRITLIVIPIVAAHGMLIPKTSSRAITSAAGTADTMEVLARVDLTPLEMRDVVLRTRACIAWNGRLNHSALDDVMNAITKPLGIDSTRWSVASILSKKLSAGATHVIIDLPVGPQAKLKDQAEAQALAQLFESVGQGLGLNVQALLTDGRAPIGRGIGPALEARDVWQVLGNEASAPPELLEKALHFAAHILAWDPAIGNAERGRARACELLQSGQAKRKLDDIIEAQGRRQPALGTAAWRGAVRAKQSGRVGGFHILAIAEVARRAGAPQDMGAGVDLHCQSGQQLAAGQVLYEIQSNSSVDLAAALALADAESGVQLVA